ncbi:MAG TPA: ABC transporter ATP-binding protein [Ramlibacter sp.]|nr:ABC transporter ATP-binding protein [Ramlibacter sp.]
MAERKIKVQVKESHRYGELLVHKDITFDVFENEFLCVVGQSGCGKTTLLDILSGLQKPSQGHVLIDGKPVDPKTQNISFVFQEPSNLPWLTVWDNVATGLRIKNYPREEIRRIVDDIIGVVGLSGFEKYYPHQISGGMKQRVAIARAFATDADVILMDEPFVSLDQHTREKMQQEILNIWEHRKRTVIFVTHNLEEAVYLGDRVVILTNKPATVKEDVVIDLPRPRDLLSPALNELRVRCAASLNETRLVAA